VINYVNTICRCGFAFAVQLENRNKIDG
jgi:hypothetical protein